MSDHSPAPGTGIKVKKRDGCLEPFDSAKLIQCIRIGLGFEADGFASGVGPAQELAGVVRHYLVRREDKTVFTSEEIAELLDFVLTQTGHIDAGVAIRQFAEYRRRHRGRLRIAAIRQKDRRIVRRRWEKSRLVEFLQQTHRLDAPVSRMVAGRVEQLLLCCGLNVVTDGLVTELCRSELLAWGLLPESLQVTHKQRTRKDPLREDH